MAINIKKYVDITSGVGGAASVTLRDYIARLFTYSNFISVDKILEFTDSDSVGRFFGTNSLEYFRSIFYFSFISKQITKPQKISFSRFVNVNVAPKIYGSTPASLSTLQTINTGSFALNIGTTSNIMSSLNFTGAVSYAGVAAIIQAAIRTNAGLMWTGAIVNFNVTDNRFEFIGGDSTTNDSISVTAGGLGQEIKDLIGWGSSVSDIQFPVYARGSLQQTITQCLQTSFDISNNFGSFAFVQPTTLSQSVEAATWNDAKNFMFMYMIPILKTDAATYYNALITIGGCATTINQISGEYPEMLPMSILASTRYQNTNSVQNYMFQRTSLLTPSVVTDAEYDTFTSIRTNFYGRTQQAGQFLDFYQRGVLFGNTGTSATDQNVYANEIWLKDAAAVAIINLLLAVTRVSANQQGIIQVSNVIQEVINQALANGTISVGKPLTPTQKAFIDDLTATPDSWQQVQNSGFWLDVRIEPHLLNEFKIVYTLVYSKDDIIRKVEGRHILI